VERFGEEDLPDKRLRPQVLHAQLVALYRRPAQHAMYPLARELLRVEMQLRLQGGGENRRVYVNRAERVWFWEKFPRPWFSGPWEELTCS
jgi:hypothetical protein